MPAATSGTMKMWQALLTGLTTLALASGLTVGPVALVHNNRFINYTKGASPDNSLLHCGYQLEGDESVARISWRLKVGGDDVGTYVWEAEGDATAAGRLLDKVDMGRNDGALYLTELSYDLSGDYSCDVELSSGEKKETQPWEVLVVDSVSHLSTLHSTITGCSYRTSYSTLAVFPKPSVRGGLYSTTESGFYKEIPETEWNSLEHENGSFTYSFTDVTFELDSRTPEDISFYVLVAVTKTDGNYIPLSSATDKNLILHHLGCPEPILEEYQHIAYHRDTITCRGEHKDTEATVTCKEGFHADGPVDEVLVRCDESTHRWVLEDGTFAKREHLGCVINRASSNASFSIALLAGALVFLRLSVV